MPTEPTLCAHCSKPIICTPDGKHWFHGTSMADLAVTDSRNWGRDLSKCWTELASLARATPAPTAPCLHCGKTLYRITYPNWPNPWYHIHNANLMCDTKAEHSTSSKPAPRPTAIEYVPVHGGYPDARSKLSLKGRRITSGPPSFTYGGQPMSFIEAIRDTGTHASDPIMADPAMEQGTADYTSLMARPILTDLRKGTRWYHAETGIQATIINVWMHGKVDLQVYPTSAAAQVSIMGYFPNGWRQMFDCANCSDSIVATLDGLGHDMWTHVFRDGTSTKRCSPSHLALGPDGPGNTARPSRKSIRASMSPEDYCAREHGEGPISTCRHCGNKIHQTPKGRWFDCPSDHLACLGNARGPHVPQEDTDMPDTQPEAPDAEDDEVECTTGLFDIPEGTPFAILTPDLTEDEANAVWTGASEAELADAKRIMGPIVEDILDGKLGEPQEAPEPSWADLLVCRRCRGPLAKPGAVLVSPAVIGTDLDPEAPERGWEIHEPDDALKITASDDTTHSSDTPSDDRVQMIEVRPGETRPMLDGLYDVTLPASGRPGLTLREAAIEAIREQDTAFSVVARHIAALFTSLDAIPSAPPVPSEGERRPDVRDLPEWEALAEAIATRGELSTLDYRYEDDAIAFRGHLNRPAPSSPPQPDREREVAALAAIVGDLWDYPDGITRPAVYRERLAERFGDDVAKVWDRLRDGCGDETDLDRWHLADRGEPTP